MIQPAKWGMWANKLNSVLLCLRDWRPCPCQPDLSIQSTKYNEVLLKLQIVLFCNVCMDIVVNLSLIMSLNLQIFGVLKFFFRVGGLCHVSFSITGQCQINARQ